jgi:hypothetical protein
MMKKLTPKKTGILHVIIEPLAVAGTVGTPHALAHVQESEWQKMLPAIQLVVTKTRRFLSLK